MNPASREPRLREFRLDIQSLSTDHGSAATVETVRENLAPRKHSKYVREIVDVGRRWRITRLWCDFCRAFLDKTDLEKHGHPDAEHERKLAEVYRRLTARNRWGIHVHI